MPKHVLNATAWGDKIAYCEEQVECRRSVLLAHFGESFDVKRCHGTCDVCASRNGQEFEQVQPSTFTFMSCVLHGCPVRVGLLNPKVRRCSLI